MPGRADERCYIVMNGLALLRFGLDFSQWRNWAIRLLRAPTISEITTTIKVASTKRASLLHSVSASPHIPATHQFISS